MITEEEKIRRRKEYIKNRNITLSDFDDEYVEWRLSNKTEEDYIYEKWINGEITKEELCKEINEYIKNL